MMSRDFDNATNPKLISGTPEAFTKRTKSDRSSAPLTSAKNGIRRTIRRGELRQIVPLATTTIYEMEQRGEFPRRFNLSPRCVVWDLAEVESWVEERRRISYSGMVKQAPAPDVRLRKTRPMKQKP